MLSSAAARGVTLRGVDGVLERVAGRKLDGLGRRDGDRLARRGIASGALRTGARRKRSEGDQLHGLATCDGGCNRLENRVKGFAFAFACAGFAFARAGSDCVDEFLPTGGSDGPSLLAGVLAELGSRPIRARQLVARCFDQHGRCRCMIRLHRCPSGPGAYQRKRHHAPSPTHLGATFARARHRAVRPPTYRGRRAPH